MESESTESHITIGLQTYPDSKVHAANMGPTWGRQDPTLAPWILLSGYIAASGYGLKVWTRVPNKNIIWQYKLYTKGIKSFLYSKLINVVLSFLQYVSHTSH